MIFHLAHDGVNWDSIFFYTNHDDALLLELVPLDLFYEVSLIMPLYLLQ